MIKRIDKEFNDLQINPPEGVVIEKDSNNQTIWYAYVKGPQGTPYAGGQFKVVIKFLDSYPFKMPEFKFTTKIFHPNVQDDGLICQEMLGLKEWVPTKQIKQVLEMIIGMMMQPSEENALNVEASNLYQKNREQFNKIAAEKTNQYAK